MINLATCVLLVLTFVPFIVGPPLHPNEVEDGRPKNDTVLDLGLHYDKYLQEVIKVLEKDQEFKQKLEKAKFEEITSGNISQELQFVNHRIRTQLDELKRYELNRLRKFMKEQASLGKGHPGRFRDLHLHVDASNPHTFEVEDLKKLVMQTSRDLEEADRKRREEFKVYEMEKEHRRRQALSGMDEEHRKQAEKEHEEQMQKHKDHPKVHYPGGKQQLEEVWEKEDHMPVEEFEPITFFNMHDINGDRVWDFEEINALFVQELNKVYDASNPEDDLQQKYEEMNRMREHVINETDVNKDGVISLQEFLDMTKRREFDDDPEWQGIEDQQMFDEHEFEEYEKHRPGYNYQGVPPGYGAAGNYPGSMQQMPPGIHPQAPVYQQYPQGGQMPPQGYMPPQQQYQGMPQPGYHQQQFPSVTQQQFGGINNGQGLPPQQQYMQYAQPLQGVPQQPHLPPPHQVPHQQQQHVPPPQNIPQQQHVPPPQNIPQQQHVPPPQNIPQQQQQHVPPQQNAQQQPILASTQQQQGGQKLQETVQQSGNQPILNEILQEPSPSHQSTNQLPGKV